MDLQHYFTACASNQSSVTSTSSSSNSEDDEPLSSDSVSVEPPPPKQSLSQDIFTELVDDIHEVWYIAENSLCTLHEDFTSLHDGSCS
jgi:hypothetical protein